MALILNGTDGLSDVDGTAATPAIRGTDTNTGIFFPAADTIAFSEGGVEQMRLNSAGDLQMNSGYGSVATAYGCRAWVNFNGTGTVAVIASGNVSSVTDVGTGQYTINFTTALVDNKYSIVGCASENGATINIFMPFRAGASKSTTISSIQTLTSGGAFVDPNEVNIAIFR
jgi:adenosylcobinamide amidohydrolase